MDGAEKVEEEEQIETKINEVKETKEDSAEGKVRYPEIIELVFRSIVGLSANMVTKGTI